MATCARSLRASFTPDWNSLAVDSDSKPLPGGCCVGGRKMGFVGIKRLWGMRNLRGVEVEDAPQRSTLFENVVNAKIARKNGCLMVEVLQGH